MPKRIECIVFKGTKFRRYPDATNPTDRNYYTPGIEDRKRGWKRLHVEIWQDANKQQAPPGHHVHHIDGDTLNNNPANLALLPGSEHLSQHSRERHANPTYATQIRHHLDTIRPLTKQWHASDEGRAWHSEHGKKTWQERELTTATCEQCGTDYESLQPRRFCSGRCKAAHRRASGIDNEQRTCIQCGTEFTISKYTKQRTCSRLCGQRYRRRNRPRL